MKSCLVVDDSSVIRKVARRILEGMQFDILLVAHRPSSGVFLGRFACGLLGLAGARLLRGADLDPVAERSASASVAVATAPVG